LRRVRRTANDAAISSAAPPGFLDIGTCAHYNAARKRRNEVKVELGCGKSKAEGFVGVDIAVHKGVNVVADVAKSLPFADGSVTEMRAVHLFEHVPDTVGLMKEIYRVSAPGAKVVVEVPYARSDGAFADPTHVRAFTEFTWEYFDRGKDAWKLYEFAVDFRIVSTSFQYLKGKTLKKIPLLGRLLRWLVRKMLWRVLWNVMYSVTVELEVVKPGRTGGG
jgi:SAM-dependent methyltransferase